MVVESLEVPVASHGHIKLHGARCKITSLRHTHRNRLIFSHAIQKIFVNMDRIIS